MNISRRGLFGIIAAAIAPAIIRPGLLMPIKPHLMRCTTRTIMDLALISDRNMLAIADELSRADEAFEDLPFGTTNMSMRVSVNRTVWTEFSRENSNSGLRVIS